MECRQWLGCRESPYRGCGNWHSDVVGGLRLQLASLLPCLSLHPLPCWTNYCNLTLDLNEDRITETKPFDKKSTIHWASTGLGLFVYVTLPSVDFC